MIKSLNTKVSHLTKLFDGINKFSKEISTFHEFDSNMSIDINDELHSIPQIFENIEKIKDNTVEKNFELWHLVEHIVYKIDCIIDELSNIYTLSSKNLIYDISDTKMESICKLYEKIQKLYIVYQKATIDIDLKATESFYVDNYKDFKWDKTTAITTAEKYTDMIKLFPFAVKLYVFVIQNILGQCIPKDSGYCDTIIEMVENTKDFVLLNGKETKTNSKGLHKNNPQIKTFGLTPSGESRQLSSIINDIFSKTIKSESGLTKIANENDICICIMNKVINYPIEFKLWNLIDYKIAKSFLQSENAGVNKTMIDRFETISFIPNKKPEKWDFSIDHYGDIKSDFVIVIEKLSSDSYRLLHLYNPLLDSNRDFNKDSNIDFNKNPNKNSEDKSGGGAYEIKIHRKRIPEFMDFVKNSSTIPENTRISEYHHIQEREMLKNMFMPTKFNVNGINMNSQAVDSKFLRNELLIGIKKEFIEILKKDYKDGAAIINNKDLATLIHHKNLINVFSSILIEQYDIYTFKSKDNNSNFPFSETLKTFMAYLGILKRTFARDIHTKYTSTRIDSSKLTADLRTKKIYLTDMFGVILSSVLDKIINNQRNVYQSLIFKNSMLRLSVV